MRDSLKVLFALLSSLLFAAACGQKGPLYLPGDRSAMQSNVPGQIASGQTDDDSGDEDENKDAADNN